MEDPGTHCGHLGSLFVGNYVDLAGVRDYPGVSSADSVDIGPDFNPGSIQGHSE